MKKPIKERAQERIENKPISGFINLKSYKLKQAISILTREIDTISDVKSWAQRANVSKSWLNEAIKEAYCKSPKDILKEVRYEKIILVLCEDIEATCYCIAKDPGLSSGDALRMFLNRHHQTNFKKLRRRILNDNFEIEQIWLKAI